MNKRLKDLREDKDLTQQEIGKILNMAQTTYSGYETGNRNIPNELLIKLALFYNTSTDYILGITNVKKAYPKKENNKEN